MKTFYWFMKVYFWFYSFIKTFYWFLKIYYNWILFIYENLFTHFTSFMQSSCIFTYIFRTFSWFQNTHIRLNQNKIFKNRVFVKILQIRYLIIFSIFILETSSYEFFLFQNLIIYFLIFELDHITLFFYKKEFHMKKKEFHIKKKKFHMKEKDFISSFYYSTLIHSKFEFIEYRWIWNMKLISFWISLIITNYLNIVKHSISSKFSWI